MAAVLACAPGAFLSHVAAAALHAIRATAASLIDVTITRPQLPSRPGLRVHGRIELTAADVAEIDGIPVTSVPRTLLDLATVLTQPQLERACEQAVLEEVFDLNAMSDSWPVVTAGAECATSAPSSPEATSAPTSPPAGSSAFSAISASRPVSKRRR
jgi:hypothetical protein